MSLRSWWSGEQANKLLTEPWIPAKPFQEDVPAIKQKVLAPILYGNRKKYNILTVGQLGAGKSSYVNSLISVANEAETYISHAAEVQATENGARAVTFELRKYRLGDNITVFDMPGYPVTNGSQVNVDLYKRIFDGKINENEDLHPDVAACEEDPERKIDAATLVVDATKLRSDTTATVPFFKALVEAFIQRHIRYTIVLTNVDQLCEEVMKDVKRVYFSKAVADAAQKMHEIIGLSKKFIIPIRNYVDEHERNPDMDKLVLHALNVTVQQAQDFAKYNTGKNVPSTNCGE